MDSSAPTRPSWLPAHLTPFWDAPLVDLLHALCVGEAENQSALGMLGVAYVPLNRAENAQRNWVRWFDEDPSVNALAPHQFSCFWASWPLRHQAMEVALRNPAAYPLAMRAAHAALDRTEPDPTVGPQGIGADFYHEVHMAKFPSWAVAQFDAHGSLIRPGYSVTVQIGAHRFYTSQG